MIIAGAGGAAHLPGMLAALTPLPVIGVPVALRYLDGMDSLLSIVQMPAGVPVATVAIGNARNAGLLAVRILGSGRRGAAWPRCSRSRTSCAASLGQGRARPRSLRSSPTPAGARGTRADDLSTRRRGIEAGARGDATMG